MRFSYSHATLTALCIANGDVTSRNCGKDYYGIDLDDLVCAGCFVLLHAGRLRCGGGVVVPEHGVCQGEPSALGVASILLGALELRNASAFTFSASECNSWARKRIGILVMRWVHDISITIQGWYSKSDQRGGLLSLMIQKHNEICSVYEQSFLLRDEDLSVLVGLRWPTTDGSISYRLVLTNLYQSGQSEVSGASLRGLVI